MTTREASSAFAVPVPVARPAAGDRSTLPVTTTPTVPATIDHPTHQGDARSSLLYATATPNEPRPFHLTPTSSRRDAARGKEFN
jgi:hypothetical protein